MAEHDVGALSRITPSALLRGLSCVSAGRVYDLGLPLTANSPREPEIPFSLVSYRNPEKVAQRDDYVGYSTSTDALIAPIHLSTHIDALIHVQHFLHTYGGHDAKTMRSDFVGWSRFGAETIPPIVTRAILLNIALHLSSDPLPDGYEITKDDVESCLADSEIAVDAGDVVLVRTGKVREALERPDRYHDAEPGVGVHAATWLFEQGMAAIGADNHSIEPYPYLDSAETLHRAMIVERGVHLIENLWLEELAQDQVTTFLFICLPLKIVGATGSWVRPVAIC